MVMTIKVIVNYPKTEGAVEKLKAVEANIVLEYLKGILSFDDLNELMRMLIKNTPKYATILGDQVL